MTGDPLDRIAANARRVHAETDTPQRLWQPWALDLADDVLALVEVARAARDLHADAAVGLSEGTWWLEVPEDRLDALGAALARLDGPR